MTQFQAGRLKAAETAFRRALALSPEHPDGLHLLGLTLSRAGRHADAVGLIGRALDKRPDNIAYRKDLGQVHMQMRNIDAATACYERVLAAQPTVIDALIQSGILKAMAGDRQTGEERLKRAVAAAPDDPRPRYNLGVLRIENGDLQKACESFRETIHLAPQGWEAYLNLGRALTDLGQTEAALTVYRQAGRAAARQPACPQQPGPGLARRGQPRDQHHALAAGR